MLTRQPPPPDFEWSSESIRALRSHLGQSQAALARELGIRQQTVSEWETGMYKPRGASITILTLLAVGSGFKFDQPVPKDVPRETTPRPDIGARPPQRSSIPAPPGPIRPTTHPDWVRGATAHRDVTGTRNYLRPGGMGRKDGEIPL